MSNIKFSSHSFYVITLVLTHGTLALSTPYDICLLSPLDIIKQLTIYSINLSMTVTPNLFFIDTFC